MGFVFLLIPATAFVKELYSSIPVWQTGVLVVMFLMGLWLCLAALFASDAYIEWLTDQM